MIRLILSLLLLIFAQTQQDRLIMVQQVFRHGARYPIYPSNKDDSSFAVTEHSEGELTSQGKAMHYMLGKMLYRDYYDKLFGDNKVYNQSKFIFKSTDVNRTIESLQSQILGIFENINPVVIAQPDLKHSLPAWNYTLNREAGNVFESSPKFHSFPVHVQKTGMNPWDKGDFLRTYTEAACPKQTDWMESNKQSAFGQKLTSNPRFVETLQKVNEALGGTNYQMFDIYKFIDNAYCMIYLGKEPLPIFRENSEYRVELDKLFVIEAYTKLFYAEDQLRATATGFFNVTVNNFKNVINDKSGAQWIFYSAHDTSVMNFLSRLGLASAECIYENYLNGTIYNSQSEFCVVEYPTYTSTLIFEVWEHQDRPHTFKIRYNGNYRRIPICNWAFECSVDNMYSWFEKWKDEDFVRSCGVQNEEAQNMFSLVIVELAIIVFFIVYVLKGYLDRKQEKAKLVHSLRFYKHQERIRRRSQDIEHAPEPQKMLKESLISEDADAKE